MISTVPGEAGHLPQGSAEFFEFKIKDIVSNLKIDDTVYNGTKKYHLQTKTSWMKTAYFSARNP
jgi:hypothetical protein